MVKSLKSYILDTQGQLTMVAGQVWPKIKLIKVFIVVLHTCKNEEDPFRNEALECSQQYSHYRSTEIFSDIQGQLTP